MKRSIFFNTGSWFYSIPCFYTVFYTAYTAAYAIAYTSAYMSAYMIIGYYCMHASPLHALGLAEKLEEAGQKIRSSSDQIFVGVVEEKKGQLGLLKKALEAFDEETNKNAVLVKDDIERVSLRLTAIKNELKNDNSNEYSNKLLFIVNEMYQVLQDLVRSREQVRILLEVFIKEITLFIEDFDFEKYKIEHRLQDRLYYSFEDLQKIHQRIIEQSKRIDQLADQEKNAKIELDILKRTKTITDESLKKKQLEIEGLVASAAGQDGDFVVETEKNIALARDEEQLYRYKIALDEVKIREFEYKIGLAAHQSFIAKSQLTLFKEYVYKIKPAVRVSEADIAYAKDELSKRKQEYYKIKEKYRQEIDVLQNEFKKKERQREKLSVDSGVSLGRDTDDFIKDPAHTVDAYMSFCYVSHINSDMLLLKTRIDLLTAQIFLEDEKFHYENMQINVKESYYKIVTRKLTSDDDIVQEIKKYVAPSADAKSKALRFKEKIVLIGDELSIKKGVIDNIVRQRQELVKLKNTVFKVHQKEYARCMQSFVESEQVIKNQIDILSRLTGVYSGISSIVGNISRLIDFIRVELEAITIWYRPEYAISWQAAYNIPFDVSVFFSDIYSYIKRLDKNSVISYISTYVHQSTQASQFTGYHLWFLLKMALLVLLFFWIKKYIPFSINWLTILSQQYDGIIRSLFLIGMLVLEFTYSVFWPIAMWILMYLVLLHAMMIDPYVYVFFYLLSIPYLCVLAYRFIRFLMIFNERYSFVLLAKEYQQRFMIVFSILLYSTILITFFRQAFMLTNYYKSELPRVLLAINFIIQVLLIFFVVPRDHLLEMIPTHNSIWRWIAKQVARYYYPLLFFIFFILVVGSPYVGHFRLVEYVFFAVLKTIVLLIGLLLLYSFFKRLEYRIFFNVDRGDVVRERFTHSKTWFGLSIIVSLLLVVSIGFLVLVRIWGWCIDVNDVMSFMNKPLAYGAPLSGSGTANPITILSFLHIISFIMVGFFVSYTLNRFVLDKIFDLLLVDMGIQHTITRIMHYVVVTIAVFIGFHSVGLGQVVGLVLGALALSLGWVLKEPISDFVAYFIILVQRPLKIGDYVKINEIEGVVRRITPRSVIFRSKNSTTVVIPNSIITTNYIVNWNYTRAFIALQDIELVIPFSHDPEIVQALLRKAVEANPNILKTPPVIVRLEEFLEYGYKFMIRGFVSSVYTLEMWNIASDVRLALVRKLRENNIEIAVPIRIIKDVSSNSTLKNIE